MFDDLSKLQRASAYNAAKLSLQFETDPFDLEAARAFLGAETDGAIEFALGNGWAEARENKYRFTQWFIDRLDNFFDPDDSRNSLDICLFGRIKERYERVRVKSRRRARKSRFGKLYYQRILKPILNTIKTPNTDDE